MSFTVGRKFKNEDKLNLWCGYLLTGSQKTYLIFLTLQQFELPKNKRLKPFQLIELVKNLIKE